VPRPSPYGAGAIYLPHRVSGLGCSTTRHHSDRKFGGTLAVFRITRPRWLFLVGQLRLESPLQRMVLVWGTRIFLYLCIFQSNIIYAWHYSRLNGTTRISTSTSLNGTMRNRIWRTYVPWKKMVLGPFYFLTGSACGRFRAPIKCETYFVRLLIKRYWHCFALAIDEEMLFLMGLWYWPCSLGNYSYPQFHPLKDGELSFCPTRRGGSLVTQPPRTSGGGGAAILYIDPCNLWRSRWNTNRAYLPPRSGTDFMTHDDSGFWDGFPVCVS